MFLERARKVVLILVGLLYCAGVYPLGSILWNRDVPGYTDAMMMSLYATLGVFLLLSVRNPSANRSLIAYAAWANLAHAATMTFMVFLPPRVPEHLTGVILYTILGLLLLVIVPQKSGVATIDSGTF
jgi:hypothetical protein